MTLLGREHPFFRAIVMSAFSIKLPFGVGCHIRLLLADSGHSNGLESLRYRVWILNSSITSCMILHDHVAISIVIIADLPTVGIIRITPF